MTPDWTAVRSLFPALAHWTYLNTATFGQLSTRSMAAVTAHFERRTELACMDFLSWFDDHDRLRGKLASLINATSDDIAFIPNASSALGLLLNGLDWRPGDEVVTLENEFPNHIYAPLARAITLREVPLSRLLDSLTARTRLVALSAVNYATGLRVPLETVAAELRRRGILFYVDATQMLGALRFDFARIQPDLLAVNCYKWMLAPNGAAFMAVAPELRARLEPQTVGWRSHRDWRNVNALWQGRPEFTSAAECYEGGMLASSVLYALEASVDLMLELTPAAIEQRCLRLAAEVRAMLPAALPYADSAIACAPLPDAGAVATRLKQERIVVSARNGMLRVSTHFYNDESDLAALRQGLDSGGFSSFFSSLR
jgi:selenocysteine lyase/cysteine desulfurase